MSTITIGTGPNAVICLNGWFGHAADWGPWTDVADRDTYTWIFPDYRGYGTRQSEPGEFTLDEIAGDIVPIVTDAASRYDSVSVLGHSMGGAFAQYVMHKADVPLTAYIGISPVAASGTPLPPDQREFFASAGEQVAARRAIIDITTGNRLSGRWLDHMAEETKKNSTDAAVGAYFFTWVDCDFLEQLGQVATPALAIVGATDPAVTAEAVQGSYGRTFSNLTVLELPDAGHYAMFEQPVRLSTEIEGFLSQHI